MYITYHLQICTVSAPAETLAQLHFPLVWAHSKHCSITSDVGKAAAAAAVVLVGLQDLLGSEVRPEGCVDSSLDAPVTASPSTWPAATGTVVAIWALKPGCWVQQMVPAWVQLSSEGPRA